MNHDIFHSTACSVDSFGTFGSRRLRYTAYHCTVFFQQFSDSFVCRSNERMTKCKSVNLLFFLHVYVAKYVFSFIPNQSNSEVGSPMLFTIPY